MRNVVLFKIDSCGLSNHHMQQKIGRIACAHAFAMGMQARHQEAALGIVCVGMQVQVAWSGRGLLDTESLC